MRLTMASSEELGFLGEKSLSLTSSLIKPRDASPESLIFTPESNFSLLSSASASADRFSFASDANDRDSLVSELSLQLSGHNLSETPRALLPNPNKRTVLTSSRIARKTQKKPNAVQNQRGILDGVRALDYAKNSFSLALKECQEQRSRSEAVYNEQERRRPDSLDLNNLATSSPKLQTGAMKKSSTLTRRSTTFASPGTPNYRPNVQKGWSSERVPSQPQASRRQTAGTLLLPYNSGRTLPSKWEDAERWIFSPISVEGGLRPALPPAQRRPKSKSGPLGPAEVGYQSFYSPMVPTLDGSNGGNYMGSSPFSARMMVAEEDGLTHPFNGGGFPTESSMGRSVSVHEFTETTGQTLSGFRDDSIDAGTSISHAASRRDMATQMSPVSSPEKQRRLSFSLLRSSENARSNRFEVRDVEVDERVTVTRWSKKHNCRLPRKKKQSSRETQSSTWQNSQTGDNISNINREEAKILAWENLQKAKAEASVRKLEMELEKKRSTSMDKILRKLRLAEKRAEEMRNSVSGNETQQVGRTSAKAALFRRTQHMGSLSGCFTCHAF